MHDLGALQTAEEQYVTGRRMEVEMASHKARSDAPATARSNDAQDIKSSIISKDQRLYSGDASLTPGQERRILVALLLLVLLLLLLFGGGAFVLTSNLLLVIVVVVLVLAVAGYGGRGRWR